MTDRGRPSVYSPETAAAICERLANGESLRSICRDDDMPPEATVRGWVVDDRNGFAAQYARARDIGLDSMADEIFDIVDDGRNDWIERESARTGQTYIALNEEAIARARVRFDARRWYLSKMAPKRYGDRVAMEHSGPDGGPMEHVDRPPGETREQWVARRNREVAGVGAPARSAD